MDMLTDKKLMTKDCQSYKAYHYLRKTKIIIYYFSASWVDDVVLLQRLRTIYTENMKRELGMEVIYVSSDTDEKQFSKYFREHHGPWPSIAIKNAVLSEELRYRYNITCLPQIVVVRKEDGFIITRRGKQQLEKAGINVLVMWSDYVPNLILPSDSLIDLSPPKDENVEKKEKEIEGAPPPHPSGFGFSFTENPGSDTESKDSFENMEDKLPSFGANRFSN